VQQPYIHIYIYIVLDFPSCYVAMHVPQIITFEIWNQTFSEW